MVFSAREDYDSPEYRTFRFGVFTRDGFKCQMPGCNNTKKLNAHHIKRWADYPDLRYVKSNGITLCEDCHSYVTGREEQFEEQLKRVVKSNMTQASIGKPVSKNKKVEDGKKRKRRIRNPRNRYF